MAPTRAEDGDTYQRILMKFSATLHGRHERGRVVTGPVDLSGHRFRTGPDAVAAPGTLKGRIDPEDEFHLSVSAFDPHTGLQGLSALVLDLGNALPNGLPTPTWITRERFEQIQAVYRLTPRLDTPEIGDVTFAALARAGYVQGQKGLGNRALRLPMGRNHGHPQKRPVKPEGLDPTRAYKFNDLLSYLGLEYDHLEAAAAHLKAAIDAAGSRGASSPQGLGAAHPLLGLLNNPDTIACTNDSSHMRHGIRPARLEHDMFHSSVTCPACGVLDPYDVAAHLALDVAASPHFARLARAAAAQGEAGTSGTRRATPPPSGSQVGMISRTAEPRGTAPARGPKPTAEQQAVNDAIRAAPRTGRNVRVIAFAGAAKTTTLEMSAGSVNSGIYIAFNKAVAQEAQSRFPQHIDAKTMHGLAIRATGTIGQQIAAVTPERVMEMVGHANLTAPQVRPRIQAKLVAETIKLFCQSADPHLHAAHVEAALDAHFYRPPDDTNEVDERRMAIRKSLMPVIDHHALAVWDQMAEGTVPPSHDVYLKRFELDDALVRHTFRSYNIVFLDEAQDLNPVQRSIVAKARKPVAVVGDPWQQVYSWRGAENALDAFEGDTYYLSQSFRFGSRIAQIADLVLQEHPVQPPAKPLRGTDRPDGAPVPRGPRAVVCRSNNGIIREAARIIRQGASVRTLGHFDNVAEELRSAAALHAGDRENVRAPALKRFQSWRELRHEADETQDRALTKLVEDIEDGSILKDLDTVEKTPQAPSEESADVVLGTVHGVKGREWPHVTLGGDMEGPATLKRAYEKARAKGPAQAKAAAEEFHVLYVALTRAQVRLDLPAAIEAEFEELGQDMQEPEVSASARGILSNGACNP